MKIQKMVVIGCAGISMSALTGCMHGETFAEWKGQLLESDPWTVAVVEPNDSAVDEGNREFIQEVKVAMEQRGKFQREARVLPSQNVTAFLNSPREGGKEANRRLLVAYAGKILGAFSTVKSLKIVGTEDEAIAQLSAPTIGTPEADKATYVLSYNILSLSTQKTQKMLLGQPIVINGQPQYCYVGEMSANIVLLNEKGQQKMNLAASVKVDGQETETLAQQALIDAVVANLIGQYSERVAPPAYVSQLRGNGLFAEITLGSDYGLRPGTQIEFYQNVKSTDFVSGKPTVKKTVVATGKVADARFITPNSSWVKIDYHHYRKAHLGTFARVMTRGE